MVFIAKRIKNIGDYISYKYPQLRSLLKPLYHKLFYDRYGKKRRESYLNNAHEAIEAFDACMKKNGINYSLAYGTMLGAIREKGFIKHDADLDVFVWNDVFSMNIKECLESSGFRRTRSILVENGKLGREESYDYKSVSIDLFYIYTDNQGDNYVCWFKPNDGYPTLPISMMESGSVKTLIDYLPFINAYKLVPFEGMMLPVFENANDILLSCYGVNYMIPDPNFKPVQVEFKGVKAIYSGIGN